MPQAPAPKALMYRVPDDARIPRDIEQVEFSLPDDGWVAKRRARGWVLLISEADIPVPKGDT